MICPSVNAAISDVSLHIAEIPFMTGCVCEFYYSSELFPRHPAMQARYDDLDLVFCLRYTVDKQRVSGEHF